MESNLRARISAFIKEKERFQTWQKGMAVLGCVVVLATAYGLSLSGVAWTGDVDCGMEEHKHNKDCYTTELVPVEPEFLCASLSGEEFLHTHEDLCYGEDGELICPLTERKAHVHTEACRTREKGEQLCQKPETEGHVHTDSCYEEIPSQEVPTASASSADEPERKLVCGQEEAEPHTHKDTCFAWTEKVTCDIVDPETHEHSQDCLDWPDGELVEKKVRICDLEEHRHTKACAEKIEIEYQCGLEEHIHTDDCYEEVLPASPANATDANASEPKRRLICGLEEHIHTEACGLLMFALFANIPGEIVKQGTIENTGIVWVLTKDDLDEQTLFINSTTEGGEPLPDFAANDPKMPWKGLGPYHLVIGDSITRVGKYNFQHEQIFSIDFGSGVQSIGGYAFHDVKKIQELTIPGTVEVIEGGSFDGISTVTSITLENGIRSIGSQAFAPPVGDVTIEIPASVETIANRAFKGIVGYKVVEENPNFKAEDGVLYTKDMSALVDFPEKKILKRYTVPGTVKTIRLDALCYVENVEELYVPESVEQVVDAGKLAYNSKFRVIHIEDGSEICSMGKAGQTNPNGNFGISQWFSGNPNLETLHLPANAPVSFHTAFNGTTYSVLTEIEIPNGTTYLGQRSGFGPATFPALEKVIYNAENAEIASDGFLGTVDGKRFTLVIGTDVEYLPANFTFLSSRAEELVFEKDNWLTIEKGAMASAPAPYTGLEGQVYVDANGVVYVCWEDELETGAKLVYCPPGIKDLTVPPTISPQEGVEIPVTTIGQYALRDSDVESITLNLDTLKKLEPYALNCPTLAKVNGESDYKKVKEMLEAKGVEIGFRALDNTKLTDAPQSEFIPGDMNGKKILEIKKDNLASLNVSVSKKDGEEIKWITKDEDIGGYELLTGETLYITASHGKVDETRAPHYRVYFQLTDGTGSLSVQPGKTYTYNGKPVTCYATEDPNTVYIEFMPTDDGETQSIPVTVSYPSPKSAGGGLTVWGVILDEGEEEQKGKLVPPADLKDFIQAQWVTKPLKFEVEKTINKPDTAIKLEALGNDKVQLEDNLTWTIKLTHEEDDGTQLGKDLAESVDYTDTITFPEGLEWEKEVLDAVKNGTIRRSGDDLYVGEIKVLSIKGGGRMELEGEDISLHWTVRNPSEKVELGVDTRSLTVYKEAVAVNLDEFDLKSNIILNGVEANVHFHYSDDQTLKDNATKPVVPTPTKLKLTKEASEASYFGEDIDYTLTLQNVGTAEFNEPGPYVLEDPLASSLYIKPENMEEMFNGEYGDQLTVTIENASLAEWKKVTGVDGRQESWRHPGNSDIGMTDQTLTITWKDGKYHVTVENGTTYEDTDLSKALKNAGYGVTKEDQYTCSWQVAKDGDNLKMDGGESRIFEIPATAKDTFGQIAKDWHIQYFTTNPILISNHATLPGVGSATSKDVSVRREAAVSKQVSRGDTDLGSQPAVKDHDVLDYQLTFSHYGSGAYQDLPMVDDMYGNQYLMVLVDENPQLGNEPYNFQQFDGYYILDRAGTYTNVVVGIDDDDKPMTAAIVKVTTGEGSVDVDGEGEGESLSYTGAHTQIKWYFPELPEGNYQKTVRYKARVEIGNNPFYTIGNIVWMNDKPGSRIYDSIWGSGSGAIDFDKKIVEEMGVIPEKDKLPSAIGAYEDGEYAPVGSGETVTYRLTLRHNGDDTSKTILKGSDLADALPNTYGKFKWDKTNVKLKEVKCSGQIPPKFQEAENWDFANIYGEFQDAEDGRQYIVWPESASIEFQGNSSIALYFELTFPENKSGGGAVWVEYEAANDGAIVENVMYVYGFPSMVHHDLESKGQPMLQKGVYRFSSSTRPAYDDIGARTESGSDRQYYENRDARFHSVTYYVVLYNDGLSRMYLRDLKDLLPKGFTYGVMVVNGNDTLSPDNKTRITTLGGTNLGKQPLVEFFHTSGEGPVTYKSIDIVATPSKDSEGRQRITFHFEGASGEHAVKYDEGRGQYYLDKDEAIVFGYVADIGLPDETEDEATNVIAMPYTDYLNIGLTGQSSTEVTAPRGNYKTDNDGSRLIQNGNTVKEAYGFAAEEKEQWLVSDVAVLRGEIVPGITKRTESYVVTTSGQTEEYTNSISPTDQVNWRVIMENSGMGAITDYTLTDTMPKPFCFMGTIAFQIFDGHGNKTMDKKILEFGDRGANQTSVTVTNWYNENVKVNSLTFGGEPKCLTYENATGTLYVSIDRDKKDNEVLKLWFEGPELSIPEEGRVEVIFSSQNPTDKFENKVYTNFATLTLNQQEFKSVGQGAPITGSDGKMIAVQNSSPVAVSFGYSTDSSKHVTELDSSDKEIDNTAHSTEPEKNYILLADQRSKFKYNLTVENGAEHAMQRLIIIDNLPEVGDHTPFNQEAMRNSVFKVRLADEPNFKIVITYPDGDKEETYTLKAGEYTVQYSEDTWFGEPQSDDCHGRKNDESSEYNTTADWVDSIDWPEGEIDDVRSIRVMIRGDLNPQNPITIPANAKVEVTFDAQIDGEAEPGTIAWNNFGYHYHLVGTEDHLEAMPLVVGVKVPEIPTLQKNLVDESGAFAAAKADSTFSFLVYPGEKLFGSTNFETADDLEAALKEELDKKSQTYKQFDLTVKKGQTTSGRVLLHSTVDWPWKEGETYTIVELPAEDGS